MSGRYLRKDYSRIGKVVDMPNLIEVQKKSFVHFLQLEENADARSELGLQAVFKSAFPIKDFSNTASLEFVKYTLLEPKYTVDECHQKGMTYASPIQLLVRLINTRHQGAGGLLRRDTADDRQRELYY